MENRKEDKMVNKIDLNIQSKDRRPFTSKEKSAKQIHAEEISELLRTRSFKDIYPNFGGWEIQTMKEYGTTRGLPYGDINVSMNATGLTAKNWVKSKYEEGLSPREMARLIKNTIY